MIDTHDITGLVLAGGLGRRMGGVDKGLEMLGGVPLAQRAVERLSRQVQTVAISANRNLDRYRAMGVPVWPDESLPGYAGPLGGFITGLELCKSPFLVTVPCDSPLFPVDLVRRLAEAMAHEGAEIVVAAAGEPGARRSQPTFCLMRTTVLAGLKHFTGEGGRKVDSWTRSRHRVEVVFEDAAAFVNVNTPEELQRLQSMPGAA